MSRKFVTLMKDAFHGQGHIRYRSRRSREEFANSLLKGSDKLFFAPMLPLATLVFIDSKWYFAQLILCGLLFVVAVVFRHQALMIFDELDEQQDALKSVQT